MEGCALFLILFAFWLLLNGAWTLEIALTGLVLCAALYAFMWRYLGYSPAAEWRLLLRVPGALSYLVYLVREIIGSACATIRLIWSPMLEVQPRLISYHTKLKTDVGKTILANSITLTPGTITVSVRGDELLVHCLDDSFEFGAEGMEMEERILRLEGREPRA